MKKCIFFRFLLCAALLSLIPATADAAWYWPFGYDGIDYTIVIDGIDADTKTWLNHLKLTEKTSDHPPKDLTELGQEGMTLQNRLRQALAAKGYYDAVIDEDLNKDAKPPILHYQVVPGARYHISIVKLDWQGGVVKDREVKPDAIPIHTGDAVDAQAINDYALKLNTAIGKDTCLLSLSVTPLLTLNSGEHTAVLSYQVKHGPVAHFGTVHIEGNKAVDNAAIARSVSWKEGQCFTEGAITKTRSALIGLQLFSVVKVTPGSDVDAHGEVPVTIAVNERVPHTIKAGANYATDQGFGVTFGWENRNFSGDAEKVNVDGVLAQQTQSLALTEHIGGFLRNDQTLVLSSSIDHQNTDAYHANDFNLGAAVERKFAPSLNTGAGLGYLLTRSVDLRIGAQNFGLFSVPLFAEYDTRDNAQDAKKGLFSRLALTPYVDTFDFATRFVKSQLTGQTYLSPANYGLDVPLKPTLALRGNVGGIEGASSTSLPSNLRFYAGGGGSVRGYGYQVISPRFNGDPIGGGSLVEVSAELRLRFTEEFGGVAFLDGGNAYSSSVPRLSEKLYYGAGAGVRYYSPLGPLRFDVGVPLNGHDIDNTGYDAKGYAIYVSLGQAF